MTAPDQPRKTIRLVRVQFTIARLMGLVAGSAVMIAGSQAFLKSLDPKLLVFWFLLPCPLALLPFVFTRAIDVPREEVKPASLKASVALGLVCAVYNFCVFIFMSSFWLNTVAMPIVDRRIQDEIRRAGPSPPTQGRP